MADYLTPEQMARKAVERAEAAERRAAAAEARMEQISRQPAEIKAVVGGTPGTPGFVPHARTGEDPLSSRPMYMFKAALATLHPATRDKAKVEVEFSGKLKKALIDCWGEKGTEYADHQLLIPLSWDMMPDDVQRDAEFQPYRKALHDAVAGLDPEILGSRQATQVLTARERGVIYKTAMSYIDQQAGGAMVAPPEFGDLIPILRNKAVLPNIGARNIPLPAQGSIKYPRQTGVTTTYQVPENTSGTESNPTFDDVTLEPHQFICLVRASNQLLKFAPGLAEATIREDMAEQAALTFDLAGLEGGGGPNRVKGLINQAGINTVAAKSTGTNGDTWTPVDTARMLREAMKRNADIKTWIMRPDMWLGITETRADSVTSGDSAGVYLFHMLREFSADFGENLRQRKVVTSNQVSASRSKGTGTTLTYILGVDGGEILVGMHGAMVLDANPWETTAFNSNQTLLRAILFGDVQVRRGAGITFMDTLIVPNLDT